jgi:hypothetical protein
MTKASPPSEDRISHLRAYATVQKQTTVARLKQAIETLEAQGRPVNIFTIKEVSGMDYMVYYRNREAFALFQQHSTHLRKEREKEQAKQSSSRRTLKRKTDRDKEALHAVKVTPRDPLLDYKRPRLVALLREVQHERDEIKQQAQAEKAELERRYHALLQDHMQCELKMTRLEAEHAEFQAFMERFRSSLRHEEHGS